jgi:hypothetical protein
MEFLTTTATTAPQTLAVLELPLNTQNQPGVSVPAGRNKSTFQLSDGRMSALLDKCAGVFGSLQ